MRQWFKAMAAVGLAAAVLAPAVQGAKKAVKEPRLPKKDYVF